MLKEYFNILKEGSHEAGFSEDVLTENADSALEKLIVGDREYVCHTANTAELTAAKRHDLTVNGQHPYAVVVTCSDARVPPEHIFNAGLGELFVIRNAGNLIGDFDLASIEYAVSHLGSKLVLIMGHTHCGAVEASFGGESHGNIGKIVAEVREAIGTTSDPRMAEKLNVCHSLNKLHESELLSKLHAEGKVEFAGAIYDIDSGTVEFLK